MFRRARRCSGKPSPRETSLGSDDNIIALDDGAPRYPKDGIVRYGPGQIEITNVGELWNSGCGCYAADAVRPVAQRGRLTPVVTGLGVR